MKSLKAMCLVFGSASIGLYIGIFMHWGWAALASSFGASASCVIGNLAGRQYFEEKRKVKP